MLYVVNQSGWAKGREAEQQPRPTCAVIKGNKPFTAGHDNMPTL